MCFGGRSRRGLPSDRREWWLLLFRFAGHRVLISSDVCVGGQDSMGLADGAAGESDGESREWVYLLELNDFR